MLAEDAIKSAIKDFKKKNDNMKHGSATAATGLDQSASSPAA